ncbi:MAG: hypothetical protein ABL876_04605 [Chitinophagaceae bacterium]
MKYILPLLVLVLMSCNNSRRMSRNLTEKVFSDSSARVYSLDQPTTREYVYYITPDGEKVLLKKINGSTDPPRRLLRRVNRDTVNIDAPPTPLEIRVDAAAPFTGSIRATPKTTYSNKPVEKFRTIPALYRKLKSNEFMKDLGIGRSEVRNPLEDRNIRIEKAYLYTITVEDDNDLHLLIGNTPSYQEGVTRVFNAEISGVPRTGSQEVKDHILELRRRALRAMGNIPVCGRNGFLQSNKRITISGSLFFDSHHASKPARCREVEGESAWEIHPVRTIEFDD